MITRSGVRAGLLLALLTSSPAWALSGMSVELGANEGVDMGRVGLQWDWNRQWFRGSDWHLGGYWDVSLGQWHRSSVGSGENRDITEIGLTPVFRIEPNSLVGPYVEAGIGAHLLSQTTIGHKDLSTNFQFGDHIGFGYRFSAHQGLDLSYRFQHLSNGGIKHPNPGINFHQVRLQYHF